MKKTIFLLVFSFLYSFLFAQDCYDCGKRNVYVYDFKIQGFPPPVADHDSIMNYYNALKLKPEVSDWINYYDPEKQCLIGSGSFAAQYLTPERALNDPGVLDLLTTITEYEPMQSQEPPDYYIRGNITPVPEGFILFELIVDAANGDEVGYGLAHLNYYPGGDPQATVAEAVGYKMASIFEKIHNYELDQRDKGEPYAIDPVMLITREKTNLDFGESIEVEFELKDCDDQPLPNRTIKLSKSFLGKLDKTEVITDDAGKGTVTFTSENVGGIVGFVAEFEWKKPNDKDGEKLVEPIYFEIARPAEIWFGTVSYDFKERRNSDFMGNIPQTSETRNGGYDLTEHIDAGFWVKTYAIPMQGYFRSELKPLQIQYTGSRYDKGEWKRFWANDCCYIKDNDTRNITASAISSDIVELDIRVDPKNFSFKLDNMIFQQSGGTKEISETYDPINGVQTSTSNTEAEQFDQELFHRSGISRDTSYSTSETNTPDPYTIEHVTNRIVQKCKWEPGVSFTLEQWQDFTTNTLVEGEYIGHEESIWEQHFNIRVNMSFYKLLGAGEEFSPYEFSLAQNYPNPFNPNTQINYSIGKNSLVTLKVFDILGREISTLVNEQKDQGVYVVEFASDDLASGIYFYKMQAGNFVDTKKMIIIK